MTDREKYFKKEHRKQQIGDAIYAVAMIVLITTPILSMISTALLGE